MYGGINLEKEKIMKSINFIKLLSVLLCIVMLLAACGPKEKETETTANTEKENASETETVSESTTEAETEEPTMAPVDPVIENFFKIEYEDGLTDIDPETLARIDGEVFSSSTDNNVIVIKTADVNTKNVITDTYTVYNVELGKKVAEFSIEYVNGDYDAVNWSDFVVKEDVSLRVDPQTGAISTVTSVADYPDVAMRVYVAEINTLTYFVVEKAEFKKIEDAVREENENGCYYSVALSYEYYDVAGALIKSAAKPCTVTPVNGYSNAYNFGSTFAVLDESDKLICISDIDIQTAVGAYDIESANYGYVSGSYTGALGHEVEYLDVFDKETGALKLRYYFDAAATGTTWNVLANGNVVIQNITWIEDTSSADYDVLTADGNAIVIDTEILNVKTGETEETELGYYIEYMIDGKSFGEEYKLEDKGIKVTDNAVNVAIASDIVKNGTINDTKIVVFDNRMNVLFELDRIIPEHKIDTYTALGIQSLVTGDYLLILDDLVANRAIVTADGTVRAYLSADMKIMDKYVVDHIGIYDFDLNLLYSFAENECTYVNTIGGSKSIIVSKSTKWTEYDDMGNPVESSYFEYYVVAAATDRTQGFTMTQLDFTDKDNDTALFTDEYSVFENRTELGLTNNRFVTINDDYFVSYNTQLDKYTIWTSDFKHVLTSDAAFTILPFGDQYLVKTSITEPDLTVKEILYTFGAASAVAEE